MKFFLKMKIIVLAILSAVAVCCYSQNRTSVMSDSVQHVREVIVISQPLTREVIPSQRLAGEQLQNLNSYSVADALRYFSGVQIKDYGGVGGIKTINVRSMGSSHMGVYYDGVELGNAQNGQVDLGQFSLDNVEEITLYNGQKSVIFQSAADFGNAGAVYIRTKVPQFSDGKNYNLKTKLRYGSSGEVWGLSSLYEQKMSSTIKTSLSVGALTATGKYKFRYSRKNTDGSTAYDTTAIRNNGDMWAFRIESNTYGVLHNGMWMFKVYSYNSERGIPGAIVNNIWRRGERQWDHNTFLQSSIQKNLSDRFLTKLLLKYAYYNTHYINSDTTTLLLNNKYKQQELYISSVNLYEIMKSWSVSASYDFKWNKLNSDVRNFVFPVRFSNYISIASAYNNRYLKLQCSLLTTFVKDYTKLQINRSAIGVMTPAIFVNAFPFKSQNLSFRAFAKKSYRMPTFNELYYTDIGNASLNPESVIQYNVGFAYNKSCNSSWIQGFHMQVDGYYNSVHDKIVAYPKGQQFRWTILNLGKVHIQGLDAKFQVEMKPMPKIELIACVQYSFQKARDVTSTSLSYYNDQIPYIPLHSGAAVVNFKYGDWVLNYSFIYVGERYSQSENINTNYVQPWYTSDLGMSYKLQLKKLEAKFSLEVNNLFSQDYEVIINYPMPKRNFSVAIEIMI